MAKGDFDGAKTPHRYAHNGAALASGCGREAGLHVCDEILGDVILITITRTFCGVGVPGLVAVRHDQDQAAFGKAGDVSFVGPVTEAAVAAMKKIDRWKLDACRDAGRHNHAVRHIAVEGRAVKSEVA